MAASCPECDQVNRAGANYCDHCGIRLAGETASGEGRVRTVGLRHGTFIFCDLVQSTRLAARLDLDDLRIVYKSFQRAVAAVSRRHGGHLIRFVGDGAFITFGYPEAREDAAESAVRAGLDLVSSLGKLDVVQDVRLELRVGVASGTVVMGDNIDEAAVHEDSVYGTVPALAVRLLAVAPPGGVVIADETRRLAGRFFDYRDMGVTSLKDFDRVRAWLVIGESSIVSRFDARYGAQRDTVIVGRDVLLNDLLSRVDRCLLGSGATVVLQGEAGLGKSRLARAMRDRAAKAGAAMYELDCSPSASNTPLYPVSVLLRRLAGIDEPRGAVDASARLRALAVTTFGAARCDEVLPYMRIVIGESSDLPPPAESPERVLDKTMGILSELLLAPAAQQPLFVQCEDMHWADATTARLISVVSAALVGQPVTLVITTRTDALELALPLEHKELFELGGLDDAAALQLVKSVAGEISLDPSITHKILARCEGNPLFLEEMARSVAESDTPDQMPTPAGERGDDIPMSLEALIQARVDRWPALKPVVQAASVLGRKFSLPLLKELLRDHSDVPDAVARLVDRGLLVRGAESELSGFRFKHALIQDAVYQTLLRSDRQRLHSRASEVLVQHFDGLPEAAPDALALHLVGAHRFQEAIRCLTVAAGMAAARGAYAESIGHGRAGLELAVHIDDVREHRALSLRLLILLGVSLAATQGYAQPEVQEAYEQARALCMDVDDPEALFPIVRGLGTYYFVRGDLLQADDISRQCLELAEKAQRPDYLIEALSFSGYPALYRGRLAEARAAAQRCVDTYREHHGETYAYPSAQDAATAAWSLLSTATWLQGDPQASEQAVTELLAHVQRLNRPFDSAYAHVWIASLRNLQRRFDEAAFHAAIGIDLAKRFGYSTWLAAAAMQGSMATAVPTGAREALAVLQGTHAAFMMAGAETSASFYLWGQSRALAMAGDVDASRTALARAMAHADKAGEVYMNAELMLAAGAASGDSMVAARHMRAALELADRQGAVVIALRAASMLLLQNEADSPDAEQAKAALAILEGQQPCPINAQWMPDALRVLKQSLARRAL